MANPTCPQCNAPVTGNEQFCRECGTRLSGATSQPPGQWSGQSYDPATPPIGAPLPQQPQPGWSYPPQQPGYPPQQPGYAYPSPGSGQPSSKSSMPLIIGLIAAALVLGGIGTYLLTSKNTSSTPTAVVAINPTATRRPTPTQRPTPTTAPTFEATSLGGIDDDFSTTAMGWAEGPTESGSGSYRYINGAYQISVVITQRIVWTSTTQDYDNFDATIDITPIEGDINSAGGIIVREQEDGSFYAFQVSPYGDYAFRRFNKSSGEWTTLVDWEDSSTINGGEIGQTNRLRIVADGTRFDLYINGTMVNSVTDDAFSTGYFGFGASTFEDGTTVMEFDNLKLSQLP